MKHLKQEFDKLTFKEVLIFALAIMSVVAGFTLIFLCVYIHPEGEIHESVLTSFGIALLFAGSLLGVSMHYANESAKFKGDISNYVMDFVSKLEKSDSPSPTSPTSQSEPHLS